MNFLRYQYSEKSYSKDLMKKLNKTKQNLTTIVGFYAKTALKGLTNLNKLHEIFHKIK